MNASIIGGTGANKRRESDFYATPPEVTKALVLFLRTIGLLNEGTAIWECACGNGDMANVFIKYGNYVISTDVRETGAQDYMHDFLCDTPVSGFEWIITNPPFSLAEQFIRKANSFGVPFAMLLKSQYWHSARRLKLFRSTNPSFVLPLTWRPDFTMGGKGSPLMDVLWTVWLPEYRNCEYLPLEKERNDE